MFLDFRTLNSLKVNALVTFGTETGVCQVLIRGGSEEVRQMVQVHLLSINTIKIRYP